MDAKSANMDRHAEARLAEIESEIKQQPLTSDGRPLASLLPSYTQASASNFASGIDSLCNEFDTIRIVRGDGSCYYRAFLYGLMEALQADPKQGGAVVASLKLTWDLSLAQGHDEMTLEIFYESLTELIQKILDQQLDANSLHTELNEENATSDYCTWFLRIVVSVHLKQNGDRFLPFLNGLDVITFCKRHVEPVGQECEHVQVLALAEALNVHVVVAYLDGHDVTVTRHRFGPEKADIQLNFLYRPGVRIK